MIDEYLIGILCGVVIIGIIIYLVVAFKKANKGKQYLTEHFEEVYRLSKKYSAIVFDYIKNFRVINHSLFLSKIKIANIIVSKYWLNSGMLLNKIFKYDGFNYCSKVKAVQTEEIEAVKLTQKIIIDLKEKITQNKDWTDHYTLPCVIYFILRNVIVLSCSEKIIPNGYQNYIKENEKVFDLIRQLCGILRGIAVQRFQQQILSKENKPKIEETIYQINSLRQRLQEEKMQKEQEHQEQSISYLNGNKEKLILEYSNAVENFIEKILNICGGGSIFLSLFNNMEFLMASTLVKPYEALHYLFCDTVKRDGLDFVQSENAEVSKQCQKITDTLIQGLKKRIQENNEWEDEYTLPVLLYYIVRNNVIKYYHNAYLKQIGCLTLEEFCEKHSNGEIPITNAFAYTYYYIYENDVNLPIVATYKKLCTEMLLMLEKQKQHKLESDLFGTPKHKPTHTDNSFAKTLSPIEQIDIMSGQEFEIYMEAFFAEKGYKVERTPLSGDYGVDLIIEHTFGRTGVQLKCYSKKVPADAVQQIVTGLRHYKLSNGMVITNNYFQKEAITLAAENHIELWDRDKLIKELN